MFHDHVSADTTPLYSAASGGKPVCHLLWGDGVRIISRGSDRARVTARGGRTGWVRNEHLGGSSLLEMYFIDVGQGDGILIKTPNYRHIMIDGGLPRSKNDTRKSAADFVDWKFFKDYGRSTIALDAMLASHCDEDHYGGLTDLLDVDQRPELDASSVTVEHFYHAGLSWWKNGSKKKTLGEHTGDDPRGDYWTRLITNRASVERALRDGAEPQLHGGWATLFTSVLATKTSAGGRTPVDRLSHLSGYLPGFEPGDPAEPAVKVLGPVEFKIDGKPAIRRFPGGDSKNTNGVSLLLRVDFGRARILLTGDLNSASQAALLRDYAGKTLEFRCDVAKACHHGADDVSYAFLAAMNPSATIISSGDNEGHDHPRPSIIAASATTGYLQVKDDRIVTPLVYSTELARSIDLGSPKSLTVNNGDGTTTTLRGPQFENAIIEMLRTKCKTRRMGDTMVVGGLIYGLVNVRTDGERILCATLDEVSSQWRIKAFQSRF